MDWKHIRERGRTPAIVVGILFLLGVIVVGFSPILILIYYLAGEPLSRALPDNSLHISGTSVEISPPVYEQKPVGASPSAPDGTRRVLGGYSWDYHLVAYDGRTVGYRHDRWGNYVYDVMTGETTEVQPGELLKASSSRSGPATKIVGIEKGVAGCGFGCGYGYMKVSLRDGTEVAVFVNPPEHHEPLDGVGEFLFKDSDIVYTTPNGTYFYSFDPDRLSAVRRAATGRLSILPDRARHYWIGTRPPPKTCWNLKSGERADRCFMEVAFGMRNDPSACGLAISWVAPSVYDRPEYLAACQEFQAALRDMQPEHCRHMPLFAEHCFAHVARLQRNPVVCDEIQEAYPREACKLFVAEGR